MPTPTGAETIAEALTRLRADLVRVRNTIARAENNGQSNDIGGAQVTEIAYDRALTRAREISGQIANLEARLAGTSGRNGLAVTVTKFTDC